jgi:hypothetical protein
MPTRRKHDPAHQHVGWLSSPISFPSASVSVGPRYGAHYVTTAPLLPSDSPVSLLLLFFFCVHSAGSHTSARSTREAAEAFAAVTSEPCHVVAAPLVHDGAVSVLQETHREGEAAVKPATAAGRASCLELGQSCFQTSDCERDLKPRIQSAFTDGSSFFRVVM